MTLVSEIISDAYRQGNVLSINTSPTSAQTTEALRYLNRIVKSVFGNEAGENYEALPLGRSGIDRPSGYPWYGNSPGGNWFVPKNKRLMLNLTAATTVYLHPKPDDGSRVAITDVASNLNTYNLIIDGNGRDIEAAATIVLSTSSLSREWMYRQDTGNWVRLSTLIAADTFPFPEEFDDFFITMLAMRLNPAYGNQMDQQSVTVFNRSKGQFQARYQQHIPTGSETALIRMSKMVTDRDQWRDWDEYNDPQSAFNFGVPF